MPLATRIILPAPDRVHGLLDEKDLATRLVAIALAKEDGVHLRAYLLMLVYKHTERAGATEPRARAFSLCEMSCDGDANSLTMRVHHSLHYKLSRTKVDPIAFDAFVASFLQARDGSCDFLPSRADVEAWHKETTLALSRSFKKRKAATSQTMNTLRNAPRGASHGAAMLAAAGSNKRVCPNRGTTSTPSTQK